MLEKAFKRLDAYSVKKRKALQSYTITYCWHTVQSGINALHNVARKQNTFKPFLVIIGSCRGDIRYYEDFMKLIDNPTTPTVYSLILKKHRILVVIVVLLVETNMISIKPNTQLFSKGDLSKHSGDEYEIVICDKVTGPSQERIREIGKRFNVVLPPGNNYKVLSKLLKDYMKFSFFHLYSYRTVQLHLRELVDNMAVHMLVESEEVPDLSIPDSYSEMSSPLDDDEWSVGGASSLTSTEFPRLCSRRTEYLESNPNPPRKTDYPVVIPQIHGIFNVTDEPTDENLLENDAVATRQNVHEESAAVAAGTNANAAGLEKDEGDQLQGTGDIYGVELVVSNYEFMDYVPEDVNVPVEILAQAPGNEPLAGPNQGTNPVRPTSGCPTSGRPISSPPNAVRLNGATDAGSANPEHEMPEAPTACDRSATVARIGPDRISAPKKSFVRSSDGSDIEIVSVDNVERSDAKTAESKRRKANKRQRSTDAGPQTKTRGDGDVPHVHRTASLGPQQCAHCVAARIGDSEGSDVAGDSSDLFDDMFRDYVRSEYMRRKLNKARRGPRMR